LEAHRARGAYDGEIAAPYVVISFGRGSLSLRESEIARLVDALADLHDRDADAVIEEIEVLTLAGLRVELRLNDGEIGALTSAITRIITTTPGGSHPRFSRLLTLVREESTSAKRLRR
jgi:hypothetical protein